MKSRVRVYLDPGAVVIAQRTGGSLARRLPRLARRGCLVHHAPPRDAAASVAVCLGLGGNGLDAAISTAATTAFAAVAAVRRRCAGWEMGGVVRAREAG